VFHAEPYKGEDWPLWSFKTERRRARRPTDLREVRGVPVEGDFVGMDVARKYLQWVDPREALRQARGRQEEQAPRKGGPGEGRAAQVFREKWRWRPRTRGTCRLKESTGGETSSALTYTVTTANSKRESVPNR
jgi:hypothetical protein